MKKWTVLFCILTLLAWTAIGCTQQENPVDEPPQTDNEQPVEQGAEITLYSYNIDRDEQMTTVYTLLPDEEITVENIVKAYQDQIMEGLYEKVVAVNSITSQENSVWIDFKGEDIENLGLGSGSEGNYFGDLARSIDANMAEIDYIYYTVDGDDFMTGHLIFDKNEPFWIRTDGPIE